MMSRGGCVVQRVPETPVAVREDRVLILPAGASNPLVLEGTAASVWAQLDGRTIDELVRWMACEHQVDEADIDADIRALVDQLQDAGAVRMHPDGSDHHRTGVGAA